MRRCLVLLATLALATVPLTACSSKGDDKTSGAKTSAATPAAVLATAKQKFDTAKAVTITLTSSNVPAKANGVSAASGTGLVDPTTPKFKGRVTATVNGLTGNVEIITIGNDAWMKLFTPDYTKQDLVKLGAPNPSKLFDPAVGISSLMPQTKNPTAGPDQRQGSEILHTYTGTIPSAPVTGLLNLGKGAADFKVSYGITDSGELRTAVLTGAFYAGTTSTYDLLIKDYGKTVDIAAP